MRRNVSLLERHRLNTTTGIAIVTYEFEAIEVRNSTCVIRHNIHSEVVAGLLSNEIHRQKINGIIFEIEVGLHDAGIDEVPLLC